MDMIEQHNTYSWHNIQHLAEEYFQFWSTKEDLRWCRQVWANLNEVNFFDELPYPENHTYEAIVPFLALIYQHFSFDGAWDEHSLFTKLSKEKLTKMLCTLPLNSEELFNELAEELKSHVDSLAPELWLSYEEGSGEEVYTQRSRANRYEFLLKCTHDLYLCPNFHDVCLSMYGYKGRSGKLSFAAISEIFNLEGLIVPLRPD